MKTVNDEERRRAINAIAARLGFTPEEVRAIEARLKKREKKRRGKTR